MSNGVTRKEFEEFQDEFELFKRETKSSLENMGEAKKEDSSEVEEKIKTLEAEIEKIKVIVGTK